VCVRVQGGVTQSRHRPTLRALCRHPAALAQCTRVHADPFPPLMVGERCRRDKPVPSNTVGGAGENWLVICRGVGSLSVGMSVLVSSLCASPYLSGTLLK
jgi:hypothetical protein